MQNYLTLMSEILERGKESVDRTGVGTMQLFGSQLRFPLQEGFPLLTTKKLHFKSIKYELVWMIHGGTNVSWLQRNGISIWNEWADSCGDLGPVYGKQWRASKQNSDETAVDQLATVIADITKNPQSRRHIVCAWNPADVADMALPPCHLLYQFNVIGNELSCHMYQRSADYFLGVPFNIASYALLTHLIARLTGLEVGDLIISFGNAHLYKNHLEQARLQVLRKPLEQRAKLIISERVKPLDQPVTIDVAARALDAIQPDDIHIEDYVAEPHIAAPIAV